MQAKTPYQLFECCHPIAVNPVDIDPSGQPLTVNFQFEYDKKTLVNEVFSPPVGNVDRAPVRDFFNVWAKYIDSATAADWSEKLSLQQT